jgi:UDP-N-acetyl-2-amino-2-deoxyglucuronate dehydrogenase
MINVLSKEKLKEMGQEEVLYRSFTINGDEFEFTGGFQDLHTKSYESILAGKGFTVEDASKSIKQISKIMDEFEKGSTYKPILNNL